MAQSIIKHIHNGTEYKYRIDDDGVMWNETNYGGREFSPEVIDPDWIPEDENRKAYILSMLTMHKVAYLIGEYNDEDLAKVFAEVDEIMRKHRS